MAGMVGIGVHVVVGDAALSGALAGRIARAQGFSVAAQDGKFNNLARGDLVLTTPADCSFMQCGELVKLGVQVVLLAPVAREAERTNYVLAGAHYIPMQVDTEELFDALLDAWHTSGHTGAG